MIREGRKFYELMFDLLADHGIRKLEDVYLLQPDASYGVERFGAVCYFSSDTYSWVSSLYQLFRTGISERVKEIRAKQGFRIMYEAPYDPLWCHNWTPRDDIFRLRGAYACIFPHRVTYRSAQFRAFEVESSGVEYWVPLDFMIQAFILRSALTRGLTDLLPQSLRIRDADGLRATVADDGGLRELQGVQTVRSSGLGWTSLEQALAAEADDLIQLQFLRTPWLFGVDIDLFVHLMEDDEAFFLYDKAVSDLLLASDSETNDPSNNGHQVQAALDELAVATSRLRRTFHRNRNVASWKAGGAAVGTIATVATFLGPPVMDAIAGGLGTASLIQASIAIRDFGSLRRDLRDSNYWLLWASARGKN